MTKYEMQLRRNLVLCPVDLHSVMLEVELVDNYVVDSCRCDFCGHYVR